MFTYIFFHICHRLIVKNLDRQIDGDLVNFDEFCSIARFSNDFSCYSTQFKRYFGRFKCFSDLPSDEQEMVLARGMRDLC